MPHEKPSTSVDVIRTADSLIADRVLRWDHFPDSEFGIQMVRVLDTHSGAVLSTYPARSELDSQAGMSWAATMHSRSPDDTVEIHRQIEAAGVDPDGKLEQLNKIGHTSPSEMAEMQVNLDRVPIHLAYYLFHLIRTHKGQEKSTRFQTEYDEAPLHPIHLYLPAEVLAHEELIAEVNTQYEALGRFASETYAEQRNLIAQGLRRRFVPMSKPQESAFQARMLDCARSFLLAGQQTGLSYKTSARDWARIIGQLKANPMPVYSHMGFVLEAILAPDPDLAAELEYTAQAPKLIRHTEAATLNQENILELERFLREETNFHRSILLDTRMQGPIDQGVDLISNRFDTTVRMIAQFIMTLHPAARPNGVLIWLESLPEETKNRIGAIVFRGSEYRNEVLDMAATTEMTFMIDCSLGVARDWNRHRGGGARFTPIPAMYGIPTNYQRAVELISLGYIVPMHVEELEEMADVKNEFMAGMDGYYVRLQEFLHKMRASFGDNIDYGFITNLLPLGHRIPFWMHVNPKQTQYINTLRVRNGGQLDYRWHTYRMAELVADNYPFLSTQRIPEDLMPDSESEFQFFDRS